MILPLLSTFSTCYGIAMFVCIVLGGIVARGTRP